MSENILQQEGQPKNILEDVISAQMEAERDDFDPQRTVSLLLSDLPIRAVNIVTDRFGLAGKDKKTLEELGKMYNITRERVRQIESNSVQHFRSNQKTEAIEPAKKLISSVLYEHGEIMEEQHLIDEMLGDERDTKANRNILMFLLGFINDFTQIKPSREIRPAWSLKGVSTDRAVGVIDHVKGVFVELEKPMTEDEITKLLEEDENLHRKVPNKNEKALFSFLGISKVVSRNPFGQWGLAEWSEIVPKGVRDKAHLVIRSEEKPLHFSKITDMINKTEFDGRVAHPQTVHNELIKDQRFVLVGRGIYALKEWGYNEGTVSDILEEILKKSEAPISRENLIEKVMEQRMVKRNTVIIGLQDKSKFKKIQGDKYVLNEDA
ncbi:sigma factor-like helix-turn-helix DNA-binding protein [Patescibacteria group bacterium]